ncbi:MAG: aspartate dehydrogenase [Oscillospiraceae bacterium]|uniref:aspartate dehydrogenase n=1 Tax=Ruminococcus sp. JL13D9 TaxID=3233381 RepID=UPI00270BD218|nr:aspartate dehydrogenase [Oscillospiraceae bacterium]
MKKRKFSIFKTERFDTKPFNPETQYAVIRSSICTGEKVAGFRDKNGGHFTEVMLIRNKQDEQEFKERYGVENLRVEY